MADGIYSKNTVDFCRMGFIVKQPLMFWKTAFRGLTGGLILLRNFSVAVSVSPRVCFILVLIFEFYVSIIMN